MEIKVARFSAEQRLALLEAIRPKLKTVKGFWTVALVSSGACRERRAENGGKA
jgi:hypothetical protein